MSLGNSSSKTSSTIPSSNSHSNSDIRTPESRRLQYLQAMGIPLWQLRSRQPQNTGLDANVAANSVVPAKIPETALAETSPANTSLANNSAATRSISFADRLLRSPMVKPVLPLTSASAAELLLFSGRSRSQSPSDPPAGGFLQPAESLLAKMLSAIGCQLGDCIRSGVASSVAGQAAEDQALAQQLTLEQFLQQQPVRLVLYFSHELPAQPPVASSETPVAGTSVSSTQDLQAANDGLQKPLTLGASGATCLQLHHPERLLAEPELKRQAWEVLKMVKALLAASGGVPPGGAPPGRP